MHYPKQIITTLIFIMAVLAAGTPEAKVVGQVGRTYPITERDALEELREKVAKVNWSSVFSKAATKAEKNIGVSSARLPRVTKPASRTYTPTYTLPFDVPDPRDITKTLYPAGYTFNPLQFMAFPSRIVFADASDPAQNKWLLSEYQKGSNYNDILLLTGGSADKLEEKLDRPVYAATADDIDRFNLLRVPSVYIQQGGSFLIQEIPVSKHHSQKR